MTIEQRLSKELGISLPQIESAVKLIDEGNTIPFIARYRKEVTGSLDDTQLRDLNDRLAYLKGLDKRKAEVVATITEQGKITEELKKAIEDAEILSEVEDLYRPYKQKRQTRAMIAKSKGLEPLSTWILEHQQGEADVSAQAKQYINEEKQVADADSAIKGALDIVAEQISDHAEIRKLLRAYLQQNGVICSAKIKENPVYEGYYDFSQPIKKMVPHRILALNRGEKEECLKVSVQADSEKALGFITRRMVQGDNACAHLVSQAAADAYSRLIFPSLEREIRAELSEMAHTQAIKVFSDNLKQLLLQPPVKGTVTLGLDPAYRTGCKIAVCDDTGKVLDTTVIYPTPPQNKVEEAKRVLKGLIAKHHVTTIAIGNGTASRESEQFAAELIREIDTPVSYMVVSEAGASVYSASKLAAQEFPQFDVSLRSAASIARRLQDPLAELVKIDPKAIGVGQYQHDMPQAQLSSALDGVVESCVNAVGVDLNTASAPLLSHIAGIGPAVAGNIVQYREENGAFDDRKQLLKVPKLGKKAFEQCAGFLRIPNGKTALDNTGVHPESYAAAKELTHLLGYTAKDLQKGNLSDLSERAKTIDLQAFCQQHDIGLPTVHDMIAELSKPGRDPRDELVKPMLRTDVMTMEDLKPGMQLKGTVRNVVDFGAFVDIGVHEDGLVHISQICDRFIKHPSEALKVGDIVTVEVLEVQPSKKRIGLTMKLSK